jgi:hypothetical protein
MQRNRQPGAVLLTLALLLAATGFVLLAESRPSARAAVRDLQLTLGGLGLGAVASPAWSFHAFDPRLDPACDADSWPTPGGPCYAPDHVGPVSHFLPIRPSEFETPATPSP